MTNYVNRKDKQNNSISKEERELLFFFGITEAWDDMVPSLFFYFYVLGWLILKYSGIVCLVTKATFLNVAHINCCR